MKLGLLARVLAEIAEHDEVYLMLEHMDYKYRAAFRAPMFGGGTAPLFDPENGDVDLAAYGDTPEQALEALHEKIAPFFEP